MMGGDVKNFRKLFAGWGLRNLNFGEGVYIVEGGGGEGGGHVILK